MVGEVSCNNLNLFILAIVEKTEEALVYYNDGAVLWGIRPTAKLTHLGAGVVVSEQAGGTVVIHAIMIKN